MAVETKTLSLFLFALFVLASTTTNALEHIQFYMHDVVGGPNATTVLVARQTNSTIPISKFGSVFVMDNPLTALPSRRSTLVGSAQGLHAMSTQKTGEISLTMSFTIIFTAGSYNGSTISVVGQNTITSDLREMPVVGGTGIFRLARGYCILRTHSFVQNVGVIGFNVTVTRYN